MDRPALVRLLEVRPPPWTFHAAPAPGGVWHVSDATGLWIEQGRDVEADRDRMRLWEGLADGLSVAAEYFECLRELLEEQEEMSDQAPVDEGPAETSAAMSAV